MRNTGFPDDIRAAIFVRDAQICAICGKLADVINHRANRGSGGFQAANRPSNGSALCWACNDAIENDTPERRRAWVRGVKISRYDDAEATPYWSPLFQMFVFIHDDWTMDFLTQAQVDAWIAHIEAWLAQTEERARPHQGDRARTLDRST